MAAHRQRVRVVSRMEKPAAEVTFRGPLQLFRLVLTDFGQSIERYAAHISDFTQQLHDDGLAPFIPANIELQVEPLYRS